MMREWIRAFVFSGTGKDRPGTKPVSQLFCNNTLKTLSFFVKKGSGTLGHIYYQF